MKGRVALAAGLALSLMAGTAPAQESAHARFAAIMDAVFGRGAWRMTGGYRTPEREDELRAQGARTVAPGRLSRHSLGSPGAPGAYDLVVAGLSPGEAAERLRAAGAPFARYQPKGTHGSQGPHLHLEPFSYDLRATAPVAPPYGPIWVSTPAIPTIVHAPRNGFILVETGARRAAAAPPPVVEAPSRSDGRPSVTEQEFDRLRTSAARDHADAQLKLGRAYATGETVPRDLGAARSWLEAAASNPNASSEVRGDAETALADLEDMAAVERTDQARRIARAPAPDAGRCVQKGPGVVVMTVACAGRAAASASRILVISAADDR